MVIRFPNISNVVMNDVVNRSRNDFLAVNGSDELLHQIRVVWEKKLKQRRAVSNSGASFSPAVQPNVYDLNMPYAGLDVYQAPPADMLTPMVITQETIEGDHTNEGANVEFRRGIIEGSHANVDGLQEAEPPLNEEDDIVDDFELETDNLILAQFVKVTRRRNLWKCSLKNGIMRINDNDTHFNKAIGTFEY